jgi:D-glycero-alpha-D-manno-heptose 1-phosphate guanylyltransferase
MEAIILAGGFGTRLASRLNNLPKPMAPVAGRPFLEILLGHLGRYGCVRVLLSVGHLHEVIQNHFGASFQGIQLEYVVEEVPLGTGGAIRVALSQVREESTLVLNGDTFLATDLRTMMAAHKQAQAAFTMALVEQPDIARYGGVVVADGRVVGFEEKGRTGPGWINAGVYALRRDLRWPAELAEKFSFERDFLMPQVRSLAPLAFPVDGFFLDIGVPEDLDRAQTELAGYCI